MSQPKEEEIKARLMKEAEAIIDKIMAEKKPKRDMLLRDIEKAAIGTRQPVCEPGSYLQHAVMMPLV